MYNGTNIENLKLSNKKKQQKSHSLPKKTSGDAGFRRNRASRPDIRENNR